MTSRNDKIAKGWNYDTDSSISLGNATFKIKHFGKYRIPTTLFYSLGDRELSYWNPAGTTCFLDTDQV